MIVETSAVVAMVFNEPERADFRTAIIQSAARMSTASYLEAAIVVDSRHDAELSKQFDRLVELLEIEVEPVTAAHVRVARQAYRRYGRGSGHTAGLNFGDCFSYALAKVTGEPLLCKGDDFAQTDIERAP